MKNQPPQPPPTYWTKHWAQVLHRADRIDPVELARQFCFILREWLTRRQIQLIVARNRREPDERICHTHDFCDPNQAMIDAWERCYGIHPRCQSATDTRLWNKAWSIARRWNFNPYLE